MAGLAAHAALAADSGSNPDVELLYDINGLAKDAPTWLDRVMEFVGEYGLLFAMVLLILWCWWGVRKRGGEDAASSVAASIAEVSSERRRSMSSLRLISNSVSRGQTKSPAPMLI